MKCPLPQRNINEVKMNMKTVIAATCAVGDAFIGHDNDILGTNNANDNN